MKKVIVSVLLAVFAAIPTAADSKTSVHALPFGASANASRLDREAADGKGGWLDMGGNDLHVLPAGKINFCGVPFMIPADRDETDKTCIVLGRKGGPARATVDVPDGSGAFLYLLHASVDSADEAPEDRHRSDALRRRLQNRQIRPHETRRPGLDARRQLRKRGTGLDEVQRQHAGLALRFEVPD